MPAKVRQTSRHALPSTVASFPPLISLSHPDLRIFPEIAGGLFHFKKDHAQYSLKPEDYATKPLFVASKENQLLNEFFLYVLEDFHTCQSLAHCSSPVTILPWSRTLSRVFTPQFRQLLQPQRCRQSGSSRGSSLPTSLFFFPSLRMGYE